MPLLAAVVVPHPPLLLPEVGRGEERRIEKTAAAYREAMARVAALRPDTVVVTTPHSVLYQDYFHISPGKQAQGNMGAFGAPDTVIAADYDKEFADRLSRVAQRENLPAGPLGERDRALDHGAMIPLYFLNQLYTGYRAVRVGLSGQSPLAHYRLGQCIAETAEATSRRTVLIASGDLSHKLKAGGPYGFAPEGPAFDRELTEALAAGDFLALLRFSPDFSEAAAECGLRSFQIMAGALDRRAVAHELLSYEGVTGVGYAVAFFGITGEDPNRDFGNQYEAVEKQELAHKKSREDAHVRLARLSLETYVKTGKRAPLPDDLPPELRSTRAGAFVSLKAHGQLRGCIGTIEPTAESLAAEIMRNAVSAGVNDPRFEPVLEEELPELAYSVDVLGAAEQISSPDELNVKRYGVIVEHGGRRGLLLPDLPGVSTVEEQISIARQKAGIRPGEPVTLYRFEVVRHL